MRHKTPSCERPRHVANSPKSFRWDSQRQSRNEKISSTSRSHARRFPECEKDNNRFGENLWYVSRKTNFWCTSERYNAPQIHDFSISSRGIIRNAAKVKSKMQRSARYKSCLTKKWQFRKIHNCTNLKECHCAKSVILYITKCSFPWNLCGYKPECLTLACP